MTGLNHPDGEGAIARAAHSVGTIYTQSALSSLSIEEVSAVAPGPEVVPALRDERPRRWPATCSRAPPRAGYEALVLTVDVAVAGVRERDVRNRFSRPAAADLAGARRRASSARAGRAASSPARG